MLTVGILGGMGPMATADLFTKIIECTPVNFDQEHLKIIVYNNPQIPSRIKAIIDGTESPSEELIRSAQFLEKSGADILAMPCNTAHYWYQDIQREINIKLINMIEKTADYMSSPETNGTIMLFATAATIRTELYQKAFLAKNNSLFVPEPEEQKIISFAIDQAKAGKVEDNPCLNSLGEIISKYQKAGVTSFIAGCTEIPLLFKHIKRNFCRIDPTLVLAQEVVKQALN